MSRDEIKLRYSGFILFISRIISLLTGLIFSIIITRSLPAEEFGIWGNISDLLTYFTILAAMIPFWSRRSLARGLTEAAKTGFVANMLISAIMTIIYLALLPALISVLGVSPTYMFLYALIALQIPEIYARIALTSILHVKKPETMGYGLLIFEICKVLVVIVLILNFKMGLIGAIYAVMIAHAIRITYYTFLTKNDLLEGTVKWGYIKEWAKASLLNVYNLIGVRISTLPLLLLFIYGGETARAYYGAAQTIASIIGYASFLAYVLYPRLLVELNKKDILITLKSVLMFTIPMTAGAIVLSDSYMTILNIMYKNAQMVLVILAIGAFFESVSSVFEYVILGAEKFDEKANISIKELVKTDIFKLFSLPYVISILSIPAAYIALLQSNDALVSAIYVSAIMVASKIFLSLVKYILSRKHLTISIPMNAISKYIFATIVMVVFLALLPHPMTIRYTFSVTLLGAGVYFAVLYAIDRETRELARLSFKEIRLRLKNSLNYL